MIFLIPSPKASAPGAHSDSALEESVDFPKAQEVCFTRRRSVGGRADHYSGDETALIPLCHKQDVEMISQRYPGVITGGQRYTRVHAAKSSTAQTHWLRPTGRKYSSRASCRQRQPAANLTTLMTGAWSLMKAYAIPWRKLFARFSDTFDQGNRVRHARVATHLDIHNRVSMQTGCLSQVSKCPIERSAPHRNSAPANRHQLPL
jgi:hypothetical protein